MLCRPGWEVCRLVFRGRGCGWGTISTRTEGVDVGAGTLEQSVSRAGVGGASSGVFVSISMGYWCAERNVNDSDRDWSRFCC